MNIKTQQFIDYLNQQFPATVGHIPIIEKLEEIEKESGAAAIKKLKQDYWIFSIDKDEQKRINEWMEKKEKVYTGAIGGRYSYTFSPTSLGTVVKVKDGVKGDEFDATDYLSW